MNNQGLRFTWYSRLPTTPLQPTIKKYPLVVHASSKLVTDHTHKRLTEDMKNYYADCKKARNTETSHIRVPNHQSVHLGIYSAPHQACNLQQLPST